LRQDLSDFGVAAGAAVARAGVLQHVPKRAQIAAIDRLN